MTPSVPWVGVGAAGVVLAIVGAFMMLDREEPSSTATAPSAESATAAQNLTPVQAAEQLFNRVMAASERGDTAEAQQFAPMALEAYRQLATLDNDAHYHVGLLHVVAGDTETAEAELNVIRGAVPDHLLATMLEQAIAEAKGDEERIAQAYERFLAAYDKEMLTGRAEYEGHRNGIDGFRSRASAALGNR